MRPQREITPDDLLGQPGLARGAAKAIVESQSKTVLQALRIHGVGRKTTHRLLNLGLLTDPEGLQDRALTMEDLRGQQ